MSNIEIQPNREYMLAGDISASMNQVDPACDDLTRYQFMLEKFKSFMQTTADFDKHGGCTVFLFGQYITKYEHADLTTVNRKLQNVNFEGLTMTDALIKEAFEEHQEEQEKAIKEDERHPGSVLMIFTDGEPTNMPEVERVIVKISDSLANEDEFQIIFLTVGTVGLDVKIFLQKLENIKSRRGFKIVTVHELQNVDFISSLVKGE